eukprot:5587166-Prymnesium_polylepis.1
MEAPRRPPIKRAQPPTHANTHLLASSAAACGGLQRPRRRRLRLQLLHRRRPRPPRAVRAASVHRRAARRIWRGAGPASQVEQPSETAARAPPKARDGARRDAGALLGAVARLQRAHQRRQPPRPPRRRECFQWHGRRPQVHPVVSCRLGRTAAGEPRKRVRARRSAVVASHHDVECVRRRRVVCGWREPHHRSQVERALGLGLLAVCSCRLKVLHCGRARRCTVIVGGGGVCAVADEEERTMAAQR